METPTSSQGSLWRRVVNIARPCWPQLAVITLLSLLSAPIALLLPLPLKIAVDSVIGDKPLPAWLLALVPRAWDAGKFPILAIVAGLLLAIALLHSVQALLSSLLQAHTGERLVHDFRAQLLWHAQRLSLAFHDRRGSNDTAFRIQYDAPAIQTLFLQGLVPLATALFGFIAALVITYRVSPMLAAISLAISPVLFVLARNSSRRVRSEISLGGDVYQDDLFRRKTRQRMRDQIRLVGMQAGFHVLIGLCIAGATACALLVGVTQVRQNLITVGDLLLVIAYMTQLYEPLRTIGTTIPELQVSLASLGRALSSLDDSPELPAAAPAGAGIERVQGSISMRNVGFQYVPGGRKVLSGVTFDIRAGARVGIVGGSGSGKSTLINLITRFYDPVEGQVFLDGIELSQYDLRVLRSQFSIVLQEPMIFSTTVAGNIAYGNLDSSRHEIVEAAKSANAHDFIERLPQGYDTPIGEKGLRLSGGERQRIAIARAFLKNAPIVILDEPTSSVDIATEQLVLGGIANLTRGRTTFMIAHRLSTLEKCDTVLVLKEGQLSFITDRVEEARRQLLEANRLHLVAVAAQAAAGPRLVP